jgi:uncharacterized protein (TIGR02996 family)
VLDELLQGIVAHPHEEDRYAVLADWLEEHDDPRRAELLRLHRRLLATCREPDGHPERADWQARLVKLLAEGVRPCVPERTVELGEDVDMRFAWVPPGAFLMGSHPFEEGRQAGEPQHKVKLSKGYFLGVHQVTQAQWQAVMGGNPSHFNGDNLPVEQVSWDDCQAFCKQVGAKIGQQFRLPTEAEWELACRAGTTTPYFFSETISTDQVNYDGNSTGGEGKKGVSRNQTTTVGSFSSNAWAMCDLHGNVCEWCSELYRPHHEETIVDPAYSNFGGARILRGGSWNDSPHSCRSAKRHWCKPTDRYSSHGCRVVLCLD